MTCKFQKFYCTDPKKTYDKSGILGNSINNPPLAPHLGTNCYKHQVSCNQTFKQQTWAFGEKRHFKKMHHLFLKRTWDLLIFSKESTHLGLLLPYFLAWAKLLGFNHLNPTPIKFISVLGKRLIYREQDSFSIATMNSPTITKELRLYVNKHAHPWAL